MSDTPGALLTASQQIDVAASRQRVFAARRDPTVIPRWFSKGTAKSVRRGQLAFAAVDDNNCCAVLSEPAGVCVRGGVGAGDRAVVG